MEPVDVRLLICNNYIIGSQPPVAVEIVRDVQPQLPRQRKRKAADETAGASTANSALHNDISVAGMRTEVGWAGINFFSNFHESILCSRSRRPANCAHSTRVKCV